MAYTEVWKISVLALGPGGEAIVNTFFYGALGAAPALIATDVADAADITVPQLIAPIVTQDWVYAKTQALCVFGPPLGESGDSINSVGLVGGAGALSAPMDVTAICKMSGNTLGRSNRGRKFLSPIPDGAVEVNCKYNDVAIHAGDATALATSTLSVGASTLDPILFNHVSHLGVLIKRGYMSPMTGIQKRRRLRLPN